MIKRKRRRTATVPHDSSSVSAHRPLRSASGAQVSLTALSAHGVGQYLQLHVETPAVGGAAEGFNPNSTRRISLIGVGLGAGH
eukprot:4703091-Prymnesium_polylepis.1